MFLDNVPEAAPDADPPSCEYTRHYLLQEYHYRYARGRYWRGFVRSSLGKRISWLVTAVGGGPEAVPVPLGKGGVGQARNICDNKKRPPLAKNGPLKQNKVLHITILSFFFLD